MHRLRKRGEDRANYLSAPFFESEEEVNTSANQDNITQNHMEPTGAKRSRLTAEKSTQSDSRQLTSVTKHELRISIVIKYYYLLSLVFYPFI